MHESASTSNSIIFVNPPYERIAPGYEFVRHVTNRPPSLGLLYLAAAVREQGYTASDIENLDPEQVATRLIDARPAFIGITLFTVGVWQAAQITRRVKQQLPACQIIVGGPHISSMAMETMQHFPEFDIAVIHEGEQVLPEQQTGRDLSRINGIIYRHNGEPQQTPPRRRPSTTWTACRCPPGTCCQTSPTPICRPSMTTRRARWPPWSPPGAALSCANFATPRPSAPESGPIRRKKSSR